MGFFTGSSIKVPWWAKASRNPFQGGMGFFTGKILQPSCGFHQGRNPFQGGMGFFTENTCSIFYRAGIRSQSLSGWDGVFHLSNLASS